MARRKFVEPLMMILFSQPVNGQLVGYGYRVKKITQWMIANFEWYIITSSSIVAHMIHIEGELISHWIEMLVHSPRSDLYFRNTMGYDDEKIDKMMMHGVMLRCTGVLNPASVLVLVSLCFP